MEGTKIVTREPAIVSFGHGTGFFWHFIAAAR
jgi:hypothetical protein